MLLNTIHGFLTFLFENCNIYHYCLIFSNDGAISSTQGLSTYHSFDEHFKFRRQQTPSLVHLPIVVFDAGNQELLQDGH